MLHRNRKSFLDRGINSRHVGHCCQQQVGDGIFRDLLRKAAKSIIGVDVLQEPKYDGERHAVGLSGEDKGKLYNFCGPGTAYEKRMKDGPPNSIPINKLDGHCKVHDKSFIDIKKQVNNKEIDRKQAKEKVFAADKKLKQGLERNKDVDPKVAKIAQIAVSAKELGERSGLLPLEKISLPSEDIFRREISLSGAGDLNPNREAETERLMMLFKPKPGQRLRESVGLPVKRMSGGIAFLPLLVPIIASLAGTALSKVIDKITAPSDKKAGSGHCQPAGSGILGPEISDEEKREFILDKFSKMSKTKVVNILKAV
jgi:hypothetical protein